jgi:hypothetical protein
MSGKDEQPASQVWINADRRFSVLDTFISFDIIKRRIERHRAGVAALIDHVPSDFQGETFQRPLYALGDARTNNKALIVAGIWFQRAKVLPNPFIVAAKRLCERLCKMSLKQPFLWRVVCFQRPLRSKIRWTRVPRDTIRTIQNGIHLQ